MLLNTTGYHPLRTETYQINLLSVKKESSNHDTNQKEKPLRTVSDPIRLLLNHISISCVTF